MPTYEPHPQRRPAVVTGASSGIGEATGRALAAAGHPVALGARRVERCRRIAEEITAAGGEAVGLPLDVADEASVKDFAAQAEAALGPIEVVVSNAGESWPLTALEATSEQFVRLLEVNLLGAHRVVSMLAQPMVQRRRGDVVIVTSDAVREPRPGMGPYVASKWGLEGLARTMQLELEGTGVRVTVVRPGPTATEMGSHWDPETTHRVLEEWIRQGLARHDGIMRPEFVGQAVLNIVQMPRGSHITFVEVEPEVPVQRTEEGGEGR